MNFTDQLRPGPKAELAAVASVAVCTARGSTRRLQPITIPSWARARMRRGARPRQRSRSRRSCRRRRNCRRRTRCYRGGRRRCNCRTGSWRCTGCWCWTGQARTNHVNKTSHDLLVPLVGGLHAGDEEATFILVRDYRAASGNWAVPSKTFTASPSRSPSEDRSCTQTVLEFGSVHLTR